MLWPCVSISTFVSFTLHGIIQCHIVLNILRINHTHKAYSAAKRRFDSQYHSGIACKYAVDIWCRVYCFGLSFVFHLWFLLTDLGDLLTTLTITEYKVQTTTDGRAPVFRDLSTSDLSTSDDVTQSESTSRSPPEVEEQPWKPDKNGKINGQDIYKHPTNPIYLSFHMNCVSFFSRDLPVRSWTECRPYSVYWDCTGAHFHSLTGHHMRVG